LKCIEIKKASLSKLYVSFEYLYAGPSVLVFGYQNGHPMLEQVKQCCVTSSSSNKLTCVSINSALACSSVESGMKCPYSFIRGARVALRVALYIAYYQSRPASYHSHDKNITKCIHSSIKDTLARRQDP